MNSRRLVCSNSDCAGQMYCCEQLRNSFDEEAAREQIFEQIDSEEALKDDARNAFSMSRHNLSFMAQN